MKRPILIITISYILGIIWGLYFNIALFFAISCSLTIIYFILSKNLKRYIRIYIKHINIYLILLFFIIGYIYIGYLNKQYDEFSNKISQGTIFKGKIITSCVEKEYYDFYKVEIEYVNNTKCMNKNVLLYVKKNLQKYDQRR